MKIKVRIEQIPNTKEESETNMFRLKLKTYSQEIEGRFERSELRDLIEKIDNGIGA
tara:strand:- start:57462 stop:57629 length:168 start_codon:yes stop_codon:yes gene_type:complete